LPSSKPDAPGPDRLGWREAGLRYHALGHFFRREFGGRVWKVSVDAGLGCPNVDGTVGTGGCIFCNVNSYSPSRRLAGGSVTDQIDEGVRRLRAKHRVDRFVAYFQPGTNTYAPTDRLRALWEEAIRHPSVVGLIVGTRPDCVPDDVLDLLAELSQRTWLSVEYGLQTIHDESLDWLRRGHRYDAFLDAAERSRRRGLRVGAHVILGLPCETADEMLATAREAARLRIDSVKLHNLYVARDTPLAQSWAAGEVELPDRDRYVRHVVDFLEQLAPECVIDRLSADAPPDYLLAPDWCRDKRAVRRAIEAELERRGTWQGRKS
jgi:radical SAM protein (TIGR01212 family)